MMEGIRTLSLVVGLAAVTGCSSANFDVEGAATDSGTGDANVDIGPPGGDTGGGTAETGLDGGGAACASVPNPPEVWVDAASTLAKPNGNAECPFKRITEAITFVATLPAGPHTIRVRTGTYNEPVALRISAGVTLQGAGAMVTKILGGGACGGTADPLCVIRLEPGGKIDGVDVDGAGTPLRDAIVTFPGTGDPPIVQNSSVHGANADGLAGVLSTGGVRLGPNFISSNNRSGVMAWGTQPVTFQGTGNRIENNTGIGIEMQGSGPLTVTGTNVTNNTSGGVKVGHITGVSTTPPYHAIGNSVITNNGQFGVFVGANASLKMRFVTLLGNPFGVMLVYGTGNSFDFGIDTDVGNNIFGDKSGSKNTRGGICVHTTRATSMQAAGNRWTKCDPDIKVLSGTDCNTADSYADVWYRGFTVPSLTGCTSG